MNCIYLSTTDQSRNGCQHCQAIAGYDCTTISAQDQTVYLTASIGIAIFPADGREVKTLLKNADIALHQPKAHGRNTFQFYREEMHALSKRELMLESSLQSETVYHDFTINYRPEIELESRKIASMAAVLRWQHPDFG